MKPRIYIAGPLTHPCPMANTRAACEIAAYLRRHGCITFVPHLSVIENMMFPAPYESWLENDLGMLEACHAVFRIKGTSPGADREVARAAELGLPVFESFAELVLEWLPQWRERGPTAGGGGEPGVILDTKWADPAEADPIGDIERAKQGEPSTA